MRDLVLYDTGITLTAVQQKGRRHEKWENVYRIPTGGVDGLDDMLRRWKQWNAHVGSGSSGDYLWSLPGETGAYTAKHSTEWTRLALGEVGAEPPEGFHFDGHGIRSGAATAASAIGVVLHRICFMGDWSIRSSVVQDYIDPTAPPTRGAFRFFGWMTPSLTHGTS